MNTLLATEEKRGAIYILELSRTSLEGKDYPPFKVVNGVLHVDGKFSVALADTNIPEGGEVVGVRCDPEVNQLRIKVWHSSLPVVPEAKPYTFVPLLKV